MRMILALLPFAGMILATAVAEPADAKASASAAASASSNKGSANAQASAAAAAAAKGNKGSASAQASAAAQASGHGSASASAGASASANGGHPVFHPCQCKAPICPLIVPGNCECKYAAAKKCYDNNHNCPKPTVCPPIKKCDCNVQCHQSDSYSRCKCEYDARVACNKKNSFCPAPSYTCKLPYYPCGGPGKNPPHCPSGSFCWKDPSSSCQFQNKCVGRCVPNDAKHCGGFAGLRCPSSAFSCVDDPRDNCNPKKGGADCIGICV